MKTKGRMSYQLSAAIALLSISALLSVGLTQARQKEAAVLPPPAARPAPAINGSISALEQSFENVADQVGKSVVTIMVKQKRPTFGSGGPMPDEDLFKNLPPQFREFFRGPQGKGRQFFQFRGPEGEERRFERGDEETPAPRPPEPSPFTGMGSGFIIRKDGHILTNAHVVRNAEEIGVRLSDGTVLKASVIGRDDQGDLAVIRAEADHDLTVASLGDSDKLRVGQFAVAVGNPMGFKGTVSVGIISGTNRSLRVSEAGRASLIQTDAHITFGNSGGPLCNLRGEVIGVNSMITREGAFFGGDANSGFGFAIPINEARTVAERLISNGKVSRGYLGIKLMELTPDMTDKVKANRGVLVVEVTKDSPGEKAGLQKDDVIQKFDGKEVVSSEELQAEVRKHAAGERVTVSFSRAGKPMEVTATLGDLGEMTASRPVAKAPEKPTPEPPAPVPTPKPERKAEAKSGWRGMGVQNLDAAAREYYKLGKEEKGALVSLVADGSAAANATVEVGDVVKEVNRQPVNSAADFEAAVKAAGGKDVLLLIKRDGKTKLVTVKP